MSLSSDRRVEVRSPFTEEVITDLPDTVVEDADRAVATATRALAGGHWTGLAVSTAWPSKRRFRTELEKRIDELNLA